MKNIVIGGAVLIVILALALFFIPKPEEESLAQDQYTFFEEKTDTAEIMVEYPSLPYERADISLQIIVNEYVAEFKSMVDEFGKSPTGRPYILIIEDQEIVESSTTVGILLLVYQDFGGAHGLPQFIGLNFNKETGEEVSLDTVLEITKQSLASLSEGASLHFAGILEEAFFPEGVEAEEENFSSFLLTENTATFYFQPYEVAPYALGPQEYKISY